MTQSRLAEVAGVSQSFVAKIEAGRRGIGPDAAPRLARALGVSICDLLPPEPEPQEVIAARAAVLIARDKRDAIRRLVAERKVGASALHVAEHELALALRRWDAAPID